MKSMGSFGFLNYPHILEFEGGRIEPVNEFEEGLAYIKANGNRDGYIYPPEVTTIQYNPITNEEAEEVSNSKRPAAIFMLPASHNLFINNPINTEDAALIIHLLGFFFGIRLLPSELRFDGKVPTKSMNKFSFHQDVPSDFISHVYGAWKQWSDDLRKRYINILYMYGKVKSCEFLWDQFIYEYMVFDAIYRFYTLGGGNPVKGHKKRFNTLCDAFSIPQYDDEIDRIYKLRNDLFHEALWIGDTPGMGSGGMLEVMWLRKLNARLIVAISGYKNEFTKSRWNTMGWESFDKFQSPH
ncbi:MAG: hypothetical protein Q9M11_06860 [Mariprofundaceae bacterium]|nr:hypothetical protein [Mariprofundaceae bacterium]